MKSGDLVMEVDNSISGKVFNRVTFFQRGHITNYPTIFPITLIKISEESIELKRLLKSYKFHWNEVDECIIEVSKSYKSYGGAGANFMQKVLVIRAKNIKFAFDISTNFPDFKNGKEIVDELKKHIEIKEVKREYSIKLDSIVIIVLIVIIILILKLSGWKW